MRVNILTCNNKLKSIDFVRVFTPRPLNRKIDDEFSIVSDFSAITQLICGPAIIKRFTNAPRIIGRATRMDRLKGSVLFILRTFIFILGYINRSILSIFYRGGTGNTSLKTNDLTRV